MTDSPHPSPEHAPRSRKRSHRDLIAGLTSGFVGALALATSLYNVYLQREQVRAQVWPKLTLQDTKDGDIYGISVANRGVGPADIQRVRVLVDGAPMASWVQAILTLRHVKGIQAPTTRELVTTIANGQEFLFIGYPLKEWVELIQERDRIGLELCYCSTLRECWLLKDHWDGSPDVTTSVDDCRADPVPFSPYTHEESVQMISRTFAALQADADGGAVAADSGVAAKPHAGH